MKQKNKNSLRTSPNGSVCGNTKIGRIGFAKLAEFEDLDYVVTEAKLAEEWLKKLDEAGVEVITAE